MKRLVLIALLGPFAGFAAGLDPPHDASSSIDCASCHTPHNAEGGTITTAAGNANLCQSCHVAGGQASGSALAESDQALPGPGLPAGFTPSGTSHRWDSGPSGHVEADAGNSSTGTIRSGGVLTGRYAKTYSIVVTATGDAGSAVFSWTDTRGGGATGLVSGADVPLDEGITVSFLDAETSPSFNAGDTWRVFVRTDVREPLAGPMAVRLEDGKLLCSTCHDQHSQELDPFDPTAPPYAGSGSGAGRHFQRVDNDLNQMCADCHAPRDVADSSQGSHPVALPVPSAGPYQAPSTLPLDANGEIACSTCHEVHFTPSVDGSLVRLVDAVALCTDCHTLADTTSPASHLEAVAGTLWPGGQYGSDFPTVDDPAKAGACTNCHQPHGWPDHTDPAEDYPILLVDREEGLCDTCHDGNPASPSVRAEFSKTSRHPVASTSGVHARDEPGVVDAPNRHVECADCHDPHRVTEATSLPGPSGTPRPAEGPLAGVHGVNLAGAEVGTAAFEYEACFRCHADSTGKPAAPTSRQFPQTNVRLEFDGSATSFHAVAVTGTINDHVPSLLGGWTTSSVLACTSCHNNDDGPAAAGSGPAGPHGSDWPSLLERRYETSETEWAAAKYDLCFKCHDVNKVMLASVSFVEHGEHVVAQDAPCNICHDPHASADQKFLINFDLSVVTPSGGQLQFIAPEDSPDGRGYCYLVCHSEDHDPFEYIPSY